jgi:hypothetical protein
MDFLMIGNMFNNQGDIFSYVVNYFGKNNVETRVSPCIVNNASFYVCYGCDDGRHCQGGIMCMIRGLELKRNGVMITMHDGRKLWLNRGHLINFWGLHWLEWTIWKNFVHQRISVAVFGGYQRRKIIMESLPDIFGIDITEYLLENTRIMVRNMPPIT